MIAKEILSNDVLFLKKADTCEQALTMMNIYRLADLPVVDGQDLLGVADEDVLTIQPPEKKIGELVLNHSYAYVQEDDHIFEVIARMASNKTTVIPVIDEEKKYLGIITQEDIIKYFGTTFAFKEPGAIIVIKTTRKEYSLSEVSRVIEMEGAKILATYITDTSSPDSIYLTIKISEMEMSRILRAMERYDYDIHATFSGEAYVSDLKERYDHLIHFLNV